MNDAERKSSIGMEPNLAGLLCYLLGWVTGLVFIIIEKENQFIRFHAMQSIVTFGAITVASIVLSFIPVLGWIISWFLGLLAIVLWVVLMIKAYRGERYKLPWAGEFAEKQLKPKAP